MQHSYLSQFRTGFFVHWHVVILFFSLFLLAHSASTEGARAQERDSVRRAGTETIHTDSIRRITYNETNAVLPPAIRRERTLDGVLSGGIGFYHHDGSSNAQATANLDFLAQTSILDLEAGFHWGFSDPPSKSISLGLRFPVSENPATGNGAFADLAVLFFDSGHDSDAFQTGMRAALAGRDAASHLEYRIAAEIRRVPIGNNQLEAWGGVELGFFTNLLREEIHDPSRKDSLRLALRYIGTSAEMEALDNVRDDGELEQFLDRFWKARNVTPTEARNEARIEFERRIARANKEYSTPHHLGVTTDKGRVLLIYGEPDHVESVPSVLGGTRRFELWSYSERVRGYKNAMFLFMTVTGVSGTGVFANHGEYRQVYSNVIGEETEGVPMDLPQALKNYIESFGR